MCFFCVPGLKAESFLLIPLAGVVGTAPDCCAGEQGRVPVPLEEQSPKNSSGAYGHVFSVIGSRAGNLNQRKHMWD
jgi:hypothetical protein